MVKNLQYWIKCDIDNVDNVIVNKPDIPSFLSKFISDCFSTLYNTINMESVLSIYVPTGIIMEDYAVEIIKKMYESACPLFDTKINDSKIAVFTVISVPYDCPMIIKAAKNFKNFEDNNCNHNIIVKKSDERNSISVVKVAVGFSLDSMEYMRNLQKSYEKLASSLRRNELHIIEDFGDKLLEELMLNKEKLQS